MNGNTLNFGFKAFLLHATSISFLFGLSLFLVVSTNVSGANYGGSVFLWALFAIFKADLLSFSGFAFIKPNPWRRMIARDVFFVAPVQVQFQKIGERTLK